MIARRLIRSRPRRVAVAAVAMLALGAPATSPAAERPRPEDIAAVEVYREQIPTAAGPRVTGESSGAQGLPLSATASAALRGTDAETLKRVATSPAHGAPARSLPRPTAEPSGERAAFGSAIEAAGSTSSGRVVGLLLGLLAMTGVLLAFAALRRRGADG